MQKKYTIIISILILAAIASAAGYYLLQVKKDQTVPGVMLRSRDEELKKLDYRTVIEGKSEDGKISLSLSEQQKAIALQIQKINNSLEIEPTVDGYLQLATLYYNQQDVATALAVLEDAKSVFPEDTQIADTIVTLRDNQFNNVTPVPAKMLYSIEYDEDGNEIRRAGGGQ